MKPEQQRRFGFTLIELIVTIVLAALAMAAAIPFLGDVFLRSREPGAHLHDAMEIQSVMENLVASHTGTLQALHERIGDEGDLIEGSIEIVENRYVTFDGTQEAGPSGENRLLKVTLRNALGESLTRLFTEPL